MDDDEEMTTEPAISSVFEHVLAPPIVTLERAPDPTAMVTGPLIFRSPVIVKAPTDPTLHV